MKEIEDILKQTKDLEKITKQTISNVESLAKALNLAMYYVEGDSSYEICTGRVKEVLTEKVNENEQS